MWFWFLEHIRPFVRPSVRPRQKSKSPLEPYKSSQDHARPLIWNIAAKRTLCSIIRWWQIQRQRQIQRQIQKQRQKSSRENENVYRFKYPVLMYIGWDVPAHDAHCQLQDKDKDKDKERQRQRQRQTLGFAKRTCKTTKVDESGWKWMKVNESGWKWMKVGQNHQGRALYFLLLNCQRQKSRTC